MATTSEFRSTQVKPAQIKPAQAKPTKDFAQVQVLVRARTSTCPELSACQRSAAVVGVKRTALGSLKMAAAIPRQ